MSLLEAILFGIIEGITEFLPISSTAHLTIFEELLGYKTNDPGIVAFTAVIQVGAILATLLYFRNDIWRILKAWFSGIFNAAGRGNDYRFGWAVLIGSLPIAIIGLAFKDQIETGLRSLWLVAAALIGWSFVLWLADHTAKQNRKEAAATWRDTLFIGIWQCLALIPGVSRSGATISAGLLKGMDRTSATRLSFFLAIPALLAAGLLQAVTRADDIAGGVGWPATIIASTVSFITAYIAIAWLLRYVAHHNFNIFIYYRVALGILLVILLASGTISST